MAFTDGAFAAMTGLPGRMGQRDPFRRNGRVASKPRARFEMEAQGMENPFASAQPLAITGTHSSCSILAPGAK